MDLFDIWNDDISRFQDLNADFIYHLQGKDAKMTKYSNQTTLGLSFSVKITVSKFKHLSLAELKEAIPPKYYGDYRYKPKDGEFVPPFRGATSSSILGASPVHVCSCSGRYQFWIRRRKGKEIITKERWGIKKPK